MQDPTDAPFACLAGNEAGGLMILGDHASNRVPPSYGDLGLPAAEMERHIAYDIGSEALVRRLAALTGAPALMTRFSRLLIDANRGEDDPTLVMRLSDGAIVPGNARVDAAERQRRIERFHRPYHAAIAGLLDRMTATGTLPAILSVHSFTPAWKGVRRPWDMAILWDSDDRWVTPALAAFRARGLVVGDNEPYDGALVGDTLYRHGTRRGLAHAILEVRQDLIADAEGVALWVERLAPILAEVMGRHDLGETRLHGSRTGPVTPEG